MRDPHHDFSRTDSSEPGSSVHGCIPIYMLDHLSAVASVALPASEPQESTSTSPAQKWTRPARFVQTAWKLTVNIELNDVDIAQLREALAYNSRASTKPAALLNVCIARESDLVVCTFDTDKPRQTSHVKATCVSKLRLRGMWQLLDGSKMSHRCHLETVA